MGKTVELSGCSRQCWFFCLWFYFFCDSSCSWRLQLLSSVTGKWTFYLVSVHQTKLMWYRWSLIYDQLNEMKWKLCCCFCIWWADSVSLHFVRWCGIIYSVYSYSHPTVRDSLWLKDWWWSFQKLLIELLNMLNFNSLWPSAVFQITACPKRTTFEEDR